MMVDIYTFSKRDYLSIKFTGFNKLELSVIANYSIKSIP